MIKVLKDYIIPLLVLLTQYAEVILIAIFVKQCLIKPFIIN